jgi:hypothetical protein
MEDKKITKLEFLMSLDGNIICQRFFNVKGYKPNNKKSLDLIEALEFLEYDVTYELKMKSIEYLLNSYSHYTNYVSLSEQDKKPNIDEHFNIYLKINNVTFLHKIFPAWTYPAKIRYTVDIRPHIPELLKNLCDILSSEKVTTKYLETQL